MFHTLNLGFAAIVCDRKAYVIVGYQCWPSVTMYAVAIVLQLIVDLLHSHLANDMEEDDQEEKNTPVYDLQR